MCQGSIATSANTRASRGGSCGKKCGVAFELQLFSLYVAATAAIPQFHIISSLAYYISPYIYIYIYIHIHIDQSLFKLKAF